MKTIMLYTRSGCRKPKQCGLATASFAGMTIRDYRSLAARGDGKFWIVEADNVDEARKIILQGNYSDNPRWKSFDNGNTRTYGDTSHNAIEGSQRVINDWNKNLQQYGRVPRSKTYAL